MTRCFLFTSPNRAEQLQHKSKRSAIVKPERDRFGGMLDLRGRHLDTPMGNRDFMGIGHSPHDGQSVQRIPETTRNSHILQGGVASLPGLVIYPEGLPRNGVIVALAHTEFGAVRQFASVSGERFSTLFQALHNQGLGYFDPLRSQVHLGSGLLK